MLSNAFLELVHANDRFFLFSLKSPFIIIIVNRESIGVVYISFLSFGKMLFCERYFCIIYGF